MEGLPEEDQPEGDIIPNPQIDSEIEDALQDLANRNDDELGTLLELRNWVQNLHRFGGYSRKAVIVYLDVIQRCLSGQRAPQDPVSRHAAQEAFARMNGMTKTVHTMCLWMKDPEVVAGSCQLIAAAVQGAPHVAELVSSQSSDLRLLIRGIERHAFTCKEVAQAGCDLVCHLSAMTPAAAKTTEFRPPRLMSQREAQNAIAQEGVVDLLARILLKSVLQMRQITDKLEGQEVASMRDTRFSIDSTSESIAPIGKRGLAQANLANQMRMKREEARAKNSCEVKRGWQEYFDMEVAESAIQNSTLQALILLSARNANTTRILIGCLETEYNIACPQAQAIPPSRDTIIEPSFNADRRRSTRRGSTESSPSSSYVESEMKGSRKSIDKEIPSGRNSTAGTERRSSVRQSTITPPAPPKEENSEILAIVDRSLGVLVDVLNSHVAKDRPELVSRVLRIICLVLEHYVGVTSEMTERSKATITGMESKFLMDLSSAHAKCGRPHPLSLEPLRPCAKALTLALRQYPDTAKVMAASISALSILRTISIQAAYPDTSDKALSVWRRLLSTVEEKGELTRARKTLKDALCSTEVAEVRLKNFKLNAAELHGDAVYLTPRVRACAELAVKGAAELTSDIVAAAWKEGDPGRLEQKTIQAKLRRSSTGRERTSLLSERGSTAGSDAKRLTGMSAARSLSTIRGNACDEGSFGGSSRSGGRSRPSKDRICKETAAREGDGNQPWIRALGFDAYDEEDLDQIFRPHLESALIRSFPAPSIPPRIRRKFGQNAPSLSQTQTETDDQRVKIEFVESDVGRIKARVTVQPQDMCHWKAYAQKLKDLTNDAVASKAISSSVAKALRRDGFLMPRYGLQVQVRKFVSDEDKRRSSVERRNSVDPQTIGVEGNLRKSSTACSLPAVG